MHNGRPFMLFGLSHENLSRLVADEPIMIDGAEFGVDATVVIMAGKTEDDIAAQIKAAFPDAREGR